MTTTPKNHVSPKLTAIDRNLLSIIERNPKPTPFSFLQHETTYDFDELKTALNKLITAGLIIKDDSGNEMGYTFNK